MKVVFAGPSLWGTTWDGVPAIDLRPPAVQGDVYAAVRAGANVIGLIDGAFESVAATWHKEILFALAQGVQVFGGASIGALRAAECAAFGMIGVGEIYRAYAAGDIVDDAAVALLHGPADLGYLPLTEALVNVRATLAHTQQAGLISDAEYACLHGAAERLFFKERTWDRIIADAALPRRDVAELRRVLIENEVNQKRIDAEALMHCIHEAENTRQPTPRAWEFVRTTQFNHWIVQDPK